MCPPNWSCVTRPLLAEADALLARGRAGNAATLLAPFVGREPENIEAWHRMARAKLEMGDPQGALRAAWAAWQQDADGTESLFWISRACTALGDHTEAIGTADAACRQDPGNPRLHNRLGEAHLAAGRTADALAGLQVAVDLASYDAELRVTYGLALFAAGRPLNAREAVDVALDLEPGNAAARTALTRFEAAMRPVVDATSLARASDEFAEALRSHPGDHLAVRPAAGRDAFAYAMRVSFAWFLAAAIGVGVLQVAGLAEVPENLFLMLICATGAIACGARWARPRQS